MQTIIVVPSESFVPLLLQTVIDEMIEHIRFSAWFVTSQTKSSFGCQLTDSLFELHGAN
jgi:hypothetical protein